MRPPRRPRADVIPVATPPPSTARPPHPPKVPEVSIASSPRDSSLSKNSLAIDRLLKRRRRMMIMLLVVLGCIAACVGAGVAYRVLLEPVDSNDTSPQKIVIESGESFADVAQSLQVHTLIRNPLVFEIMARLSGKHNSVKAGTCTLTRAESAEQILDKITSGCHDFKSITFYPGATLYRSLSKPTSMDVSDVLLAAGYSQTEIDTALAASYTTSSTNLFADKPASADLEGYVYGDTYYVDVDATAQEVLQTAFDQMAQVIKDGDYVDKFRAQGLNLYEGITLASIVQRELSCTSGSTGCFNNQAMVAQVFYSRLSSSMTLGSDVTFYYAADKLGVAPSTTVDSLYNTRIHSGLPPGPIATPGLHALNAVANPASTNYLFFIAGDDGNVYFAHTDAEHQANVAKYCQKLCSEL